MGFAKPPRAINAPCLMSIFDILAHIPHITRRSSNHHVPQILCRCLTLSPFSSSTISVSVCPSSPFAVLEIVIECQQSSNPHAPSTMPYCGIDASDHCSTAFQLEKMIAAEQGEGSAVHGNVERNQKQWKDVLEDGL